VGQQQIRGLHGARQQVGGGGGHRRQAPREAGARVAQQRREQVEESVRRRRARRRVRGVRGRRRRFRPATDGGELGQPVERGRGCSAARESLGRLREQRQQAVLVEPVRGEPAPPALAVGGGERRQGTPAVEAAVSRRGLLTLLSVKDGGRSVAGQPRPFAERERLAPLDRAGDPGIAGSGGAGRLAGIGGRSAGGCRRIAAPPPGAGTSLAADQTQQMQQPP
jgi:hypothetical protein